MNKFSAAWSSMRVSYSYSHLEDYVQVIAHREENRNKSEDKNAIVLFGPRKIVCLDPTQEWKSITRS